MTKLHLEVTIEQAKVISEALDLFVRIHIGQIGEIEYLFRGMEIRKKDGHFTSYEENEEIRSYCEAIKRVLGHPSNGNWSIGNTMVNKSAHRAYEIEKVIDKVIAVYNNPNPEFKGVNYQGLSFRYTNDPEPKAEIKE